MSDIPPFWKISAYWGLFTDPYSEKTPLEKGKLEHTVIATDYIYERILTIVKEFGTEKVGLTLFSNEEIEKLHSVHKLIKSTSEFLSSSAKVENVSQFGEIIENLQNRISSLEIGDYMLVPGGWKGKLSTGVIVHIIHQVGENNYSLITCNSGQGLEYHPSSVAADDSNACKIKYKTSIRLDNISSAKIKDVAFWSYLLHLWMKDPPSEFSRVELIYDVLLPWISSNDAGKSGLSLQEAIVENDPLAKWSTPQRANTSYWKSFSIAVQYILRSLSISVKQLKQLNFIIKKEFLTKSVQDLVDLGKNIIPESTMENVKANGFLDYISPSLDEFLSSGVENVSFDLIKNLLPGQLKGKDGSEISKESLEGKTIGLYFSAHWCPPCRAFTPILAQLYEKVKEKNHSFEVIFISSDRSEGEFNEYFQTMPWLALPYSSPARTKLSQLLGIRGIPSLNLFNEKGVLFSKEGRNLVMEDQNGDKFPWNNSITFDDIIALIEQPLIAPIDTDFKLEDSDRNQELIDFAANSMSEKNKEENKEGEEKEEEKKEEKEEETISNIEPEIVCEGGVCKVNIDFFQSPEPSEEKKEEKREEKEETISNTETKIVCEGGVCSIEPNIAEKSDLEKSSGEDKNKSVEGESEKIEIEKKVEIAHPLIPQVSHHEYVTASSLAGEAVGVAFYSTKFYDENFIHALRNLNIKLQKRNIKFHIIFVCLDDEDGSLQYYRRFGKTWHFVDLAKDISSRNKLRASIGKGEKIETPRLVIFDSKGCITTSQGEKSLLKDPNGNRFPWHDKLSFSDILPFVQSKLQSKDAQQTSVELEESIKRKVTAVYFSAGWCGPCQSFTPQLASVYQSLKEQGKEFEVIFVSFDRAEQDFKDYYAKMPWITMTYDSIDSRKGLADLLKVNGIPSLFIFDAEGFLISDKGTAIISSDPTGAKFPWDSVEDSDKFEEEKQAYLQLIDENLFRIGCEQFARHALKEYRSGALSDAEIGKVHEQISSIQEVVRCFPVEAFAGGIPPTFSSSLKCKSIPFPRGELLTLSGMEEYAGSDFDKKTPKLTDMLSQNPIISDISIASKEIKDTLAICTQLLSRARDGSTTSRTVLQYQSLCLISNLFTKVLPVPKPIESDKSHCIWRKDEITKVQQMELLSNLYTLVSYYATVWQSIEYPTREFDSEKTLVSYCALAIFEVIVKTIATEEPLLLSQLLNEDNYRLSHGICDDNRDFKKNCASLMELIDPQYVVVRNDLLEYFDSVERVSKDEIFDLRMPEAQNFELQRYTATAIFFRRLIERYGYELISAKDPNPPPEMKALVMWMTSMDYPLLGEHPDFQFLRDTVILCKFLATSEPYENELLRKRLNAEGAPKWHISFGDTSGANGHQWSTSSQQLYWELQNVRGPDLDIADISIFAFGYRDLSYGEGLVLQSPSSLPRILSKTYVTEDDILHIDKLPTFNDVLSREESELLLSYLTVEYVRIPLVVAFFASQDRHMYLFIEKLQKLFRSVLFESGSWVSSSKHLIIDEVPIRMTKDQVEYAQKVNLFHANSEKKDQNSMELLSTSFGLLFNELSQSPDATLKPLLTIFKSVLELKNSSVYSNDACYILYILLLAIDIESFIDFVIEDKINKKSDNNLQTLQNYKQQIFEFIHVDAATFLDKWESELQEYDDLPSLCVIYSYKALLWTNTPKDLTDQMIIDIYGNIGFVRNWHGFGKGENRTDLISDSVDGLNAESRLSRFLQAHGIDTRNLSKDTLAQYVNETHRPLFLHLQNRTVRIPTLQKKKIESSSDLIRLPPADVPEHRIFSLLQKKRVQIIQWLDGHYWNKENQFGQDYSNRIFSSIIQIALRSKQYENCNWFSEIEGRGVYKSDTHFLTFDAQSAEILWQNEELSPLPDSMTTYNDFQTFFSKEILHCAVKSRKEHKFTVQIVGKNYTLSEWDSPRNYDMGVGAPQLGESMKKSCIVCGKIGVCWECTCSVLVCDAPSCPSCGARKSASETDVVTDCVFEGVEFNRPFNLYSNAPHPVPSEAWIVEIIKPILLHEYPPCGNKLSFPILFPKEHISKDQHSARLIAFDPGDSRKNDSTWREYVVWKHQQCLFVYNLVSNGRRVYRSQIYSSISRLSLHCLPPVAALNPTQCKPFNKYVLYSAGDIKQTAKVSSSLVINRILDAEKVETYLPPRLLQGVIPGILLESFHFWQGENLEIRGEPVDKNSQWFSYSIIIHFNKSDDSSVFNIIRRPLNADITDMNQPQSLRSSLRQSVEEDLDSTILSLRQSTGLPISVCKSALIASENNPTQAVELLLDNENPSSNLRNSTSDAPVISIPNQFVAPQFGRLFILEEEGFLPNASRYALLMFNGDVDLARSWLIDETNENKINELNSLEETILTHSDSSVGSLQDSLLRSSISSQDLDLDLHLINILDLPEDNEIFSLARVLTRLEDVSHILIWGKRQSSSDGVGDYNITIIELPRLKVKFQPKKETDGSVKLYLLDHSGWFVSSLHGSTDKEDIKFLDGVLKGIEYCVILENSAKEYQVMVVNHDLYRPVIQEDSFSIKLVGDRASLGWQQVMDTRYYLYPIHTSKCFLLPKSLSSSLYLLLLRMLNKQYREAFEMIESCYVDTPFTAEESWVFDQFSRIKDDMHPDAHASKIKLSIAVSFNRSTYQWELHEELTKYIKKIEHVSSYCKLSEEEELEAAHLSKAGSRTIRNRRAYLLALKNNTLEVEQKGEEIKIGGNPWIIQTQYGSEYLGGSDSISRVQFIAPVDAPGEKNIPEANIYTIIFNDFMLFDSEGGSDRKLGFLFLYQLLKQKFTINILGEDYSKSFGEILSRAFQLKLVRFGKERSGNEQDLIASVHMSQLAALIQTPYFDWPDVPTDAATVSSLNRGIYLYSGQAAKLDIRFFFDRLSFTFKEYMATEIRQDNYDNTYVIVQSIRSLYSTFTKKVAIQPYYNNYLLDHGRVVINNTRCDKHTLDLNQIAENIPKVTKEDLLSFVSLPLAPIDLSNYISLKDKGEENSLSALPFDLNFHPASHTLVAEDLIERLEEDIRYYATKDRSSKTPIFHFLSPENIQEYGEDPSHISVDKAISKLENLIHTLDKLQESDSELTSSLLNQLCEEVNQVEINDDKRTEKVIFLLFRLSNIKITVDPKLLLKLILSSEAAKDLSRLNPFINPSNISKILQSTSIILFYSNRISHSNRAIALAKSLVDMLKQLQKTFSQRLSNSLRSSVTIVNQALNITERIKHTTADLCSLLVCRRHYVDQISADNNEIYEYDPRFLIFEYLFDLMLRDRQVEMVRWFIDNIKNKVSRVQQMIMGAGKTTVVGPLLALILADGNSLVSQVMPTALLDQTRNIMRSRFNVIISKRIFTLKFDRSCDVSVELVAEIFAKLDSARRHQSIICSSPEAIKSLYLKFIEQLHSIEQYTDPATSIEDIAQFYKDKKSAARKGKEDSQLYDKVINRSEMADHLVKILDLWKNGILIMDEVDVLLHPLRSELNFPIGHKNAIDMAGLRWDLPIHLINAIFFAQYYSSSISTHALDPSIDLTPVEGIEEPTKILQLLSNAIQLGYEKHTIQRNPHLVLLDLFFYHKHMRELLAKWSLFWLFQHFIGAVKVPVNVLLDYLQGHKIEEHRAAIEEGLLPESKKLLNLASNWIRSLLPHVISKINRVSYGILGPADLSFIDIEKTPRSRLLMAVPFIGKDVPSRSSEFAHPDALIGLTILAYRYEGVRKSDLLSIVSQLKRDYSQQIGPRDQRPASILFQYWLSLCKTNLKGSSGNNISYQAVLPLALFQPSDQNQLTELFNMVRYLPQLIHYYLAQHIFPSCMNFQEIKLSACGHELGSNILFEKRIGFSGTPSNLLPVDLGKCEYEPGSDGSIINVLTSPQVTTASIKENWTAKSLLRDIATSDPPFHALIDTGALITGMDNEEVAHYLLLHLPVWMEGVVYLDRQDRQMILLRSSGRSIHLNQCGISPDRRFTFYDQVHTTGMDIKQMPSARAVVTIGKDMTFRDYAQGSYRMRGIGKGQTIHLFIIPEVQNRIIEELELVNERSSQNNNINNRSITGRAELDVPAWLLINSMRMESVQFVQLSQQELYNIWRKTGYSTLVDEIHVNRPSQSTDQRLRRFRNAQADENSQDWLRKCVALFREPISFEIEDHVPVSFSYLTKMNQLVEKHKTFNNEINQKLVDKVLDKVKQVSDKQAMEAIASYKSEMLHEQEAEEEQEVLLEEEEEQESMFTRDDEQHNPWNISVLSSTPIFSSNDKEEDENEDDDGKLKLFGAFYRFSSFQVRKTQPKLSFPKFVLITDNFFRPSWIGLGDRRLKNAILFAYWTPSISQPENTFLIAVSLAEGESIRRLVHYLIEEKSEISYSIAVVNINGSVLDHTQNFNQEKVDKDQLTMGLQSFRFFNGEMFYSDDELNLLEKSLIHSSIEERLSFYLECLRLRRRQRNVWCDTPIARIFTDTNDWHLIRQKSKAMKISTAILRRVKKQKIIPFVEVNEDQLLKYNDIVSLLDKMQLGYSLVDYYDVIKLADRDNNGFVYLILIIINYFIFFIFQKVIN